MADMPKAMCLTCGTATRNEKYCSHACKRKAAYVKVTCPWRGCFRGPGVHFRPQSRQVLLEVMLLQVKGYATTTFRVCLGDLSLRR